MNRELTRQSMNGLDRAVATRTYSPAVDIAETREALLLLVDLPGATESSIDVTLEKDTLTISASVKERGRNNVEPSHVEFGGGYSYRRSFVLAREIDRDGITAKFTHGVLELTLPKAKAEIARKITVKAS